MTATSSYPKISNTSSKSQEKAALEAFAASLGDQTYLKSLMSPKLVAWFFAQVDSDLNCDFFAQVDYDEKQLREEIGRERASRMTSEHMIERLEKQVEDQVQQMALFKQDFDERVDSLKDDLGKRTVELGNEIARANAWQDKATETENYLERAEATILRLKAKIYDLEHGAE